MFYGIRYHTFIVRNHDDNDRYLVNTKNLIDALRVLDESRAAAICCGLVCKNKAAPASLKNQLQAVSDKWVLEARAKMAGSTEPGRAQRPPSRGGGGGREGATGMNREEDDQNEREPPSIALRRQLAVLCEALQRAVMTDGDRATVMDALDGLDALADRLTAADADGVKRAAVAPSLHARRGGLA